LQQFVTAIFSNFTITVLAIAAIAVAISVVRRGRGNFPEAAIAYYCLIAVGLGFFYNFVMHVFFGEMTAAFIGWADSPFQAEVGWASLGFALLGLLAFRGGFEMRLAAVIGPAAFLLGAATGHAWQMISAGNFAPGNAGTVFYTDILTPLLGFLLLWLRYRGGRSRRSRV